MDFPRVKASIAMLGLPMATAASAQIPYAGSPQETRVTCSSEKEVAHYKVWTNTVYDGSPLQVSGSGLMSMGFKPIEHEERGPSVSFTLAKSNLFTIVAVSVPYDGRADSTVSATFAQNGFQIPLAAYRLSPNDSRFAGEAAAAIDLSKPATVTFAANGRTFSRMNIPGFDARQQISQFVGLSRDAAAARGCNRYVSPGSAPCFLTTATVEHVGLADDCWELRVLRRFRDTVLDRDEAGRRMVEEYYALAPAIIEAVNDRRDARAIWLYTYWTGVLPSAIAARLGCHRLALHFYRRMVRVLSGAPGVEPLRQRVGTG